MTERPEQSTSPGSSLNPGLKSETDTSHDVERSRAPLETTMAHEGQGRVWPLVWLVVAIVGVPLVIYFLV
ncbi:MAG: hypothetical protein ABR601_05535 [Parasphingopyxis sp.]|nr:hypothetical protein [Sphingomonadales bacterium]